MRSPDDVTFTLAPMYAKQGIRFINAAATGIDLDARTVTTSAGETFAYDRLFLGTGPRLAFEKVPGLGPHDGYTQSVCNLDLQAICILDAGNGGVIFKADRVLSDDATARVFAGPQAHWANIAFERIFLGSRNRGRLVI